MGYKVIKRYWDGGSVETNSSPGPGGQDKRIISSFISNKFRYQALICRDPANFGKLKIKRFIFLVIIFNIYNDNSAMQF